jgi:hypothetical protein
MQSMALNLSVTGTLALSVGVCRAAAGRYGASPNLVDSACSGLCSPGYACPAGSTTPTFVQCTSGRYSLGSAAACSDCSAGRYGAEVARSADCTLSCPPGSHCPAGSALSIPCPAGRYGSAGGLTSSACTAGCPLGNYCPTGAVGPVSCPAGEGKRVNVLAGHRPPSSSGPHASVARARSEMQPWPHHPLSRCFARRKVWRCRPADRCLLLWHLRGRLLLS